MLGHCLVSKAYPHTRAALTHRLTLEEQLTRPLAHLPVLRQSLPPLLLLPAQRARPLADYFTWISAYLLQDIHQERVLGFGRHSPYP